MKNRSKTKTVRK